VGTFKFINVEVDESAAAADQDVSNDFSTSPRSSRSGRSSRGRRREKEGQKEKGEEEEEDGVEEVLRTCGLETYLSVFVLNGYEDLESMRNLTAADLDYLGVQTEEHRQALLDAAREIKRKAAESEDSAEDTEDTEEDQPSSPTSTTVSSSSPQLSLPPMFRRLSFPRDSGCFVNSSAASASSNDNVPSSPSLMPNDGAASPTSGGSLAESGIHEDEVCGGRRDYGGSSEDSDTVTCSPGGTSTPLAVRPRAAATKSLRERRTAEAAASSGLLHGHQEASEDRFEQLVQKYSSSSARRPSMEFSAIKSVFESQQQS